MDTLRNEIATDPLGIGYAGMTADQVAGSLNAKTRTRNRQRMAASEEEARRLNA